MKRRIGAAALAALAIILTFIALGVKGQEDLFFPVSVWYGGGKARAPMIERPSAANLDAWRTDLAKIKELGFNAVRCWVEWTSSEKEPGKYDFSTQERLLDLADQVGLRVLIQVYIDSAPDWLGARYPDARFVAQSGDAIPSQAAPGFCFDHPGVRERALAFLSAAAEMAAKKPAFYAWDLWSEPHIINWAIINYIPDAQFCYCPYTQARFRRWLEKKYGALERLNSAWYRNFASWDEVEPPRFGTILSYTDFIDWKAFIADKLAEDLKMRAEAVRRFDSSHIVTSHAAVPAVFTTPYIGAGAADDWRMAAVVDYYGTSIYPKHSTPATHWPLERRALALDFIRSMCARNGGFYIGELQGGFGTRGVIVSEPVTAEDIREWSWSAVARGARAINYYAWYPMSSGYESGGYGLIELDGRVTERSRAAGQIARIITRNAELFLKSRPAKAEVAILYNPLSHLVGGEQHTGPLTALRDSLSGLYRALFEKNIPVDFVHADELGEERLKDYKLLFVPYPIMLKGSSARAIARYVELGGRVVAEARPAWNDERGYAAEVIPGFGLHKVFGAREAEVRLREKPTIKITARHESLPLLVPGEELEGEMFEEAFEPMGGKVLAEFSGGGAAIVAAQHGRGRTVLIGSFVGMAYEKRRNGNSGKLLRGFAEWAGVAPPVSVAGGDGSFVEARLLVGDKHRILFGFNHSGQVADARFALRLPEQRYSALDLVAEKEAPAKYSGGALFLSKRLEPREVWVVLIR